MAIRRALLMVLALAASAASAQPAGVTLIGKGVLPGTALDKSGLTGNICQAGTPANCIPSATLGGLGSAVAYTGSDNVYVAAPDRGPFDGLTDVPYLNRVHFLHIKTDVGKPFPNIRTTLLDTRLLKNERGQTFVGSTAAFNVNNPRATLRLDPEGIRVGLLGTLLISDEYGPYVFEFGPHGHLLRRLDVPEQLRHRQPERRPERRAARQRCGPPGQPRHGRPRDHARRSVPVRPDAERADPGRRPRSPERRRAWASTAASSSSTS